MKWVKDWKKLKSEANSFQMFIVLKETVTFIVIHHTTALRHCRFFITVERICKTTGNQTVLCKVFGWMRMLHPSSAREYNIKSKCMLYFLFWAIVQTSYLSYSNHAPHEADRDTGAATVFG